MVVPVAAVVKFVVAPEQTVAGTGCWVMVITGVVTVKFVALVAVLPATVTVIRVHSKSREFFFF